MAALLGSVASKMARASPRLLGPRAAVPSVPGSPRLLWLSSSSTSGGFNGTVQGSLSHNKKVPSELDRAKAEFIGTFHKTAYFLACTSVTFICFWVNPALDRINDNLEAGIRQKADMRDEIIRSHQRIRELESK